MQPAEKKLLPSGLYDLLPPYARQEVIASCQMLDSFHHLGYEQVSPPLLEFEETLLSGRGQTLANDTIKVLDTLSQKTMGVRADMTLQVARIAGTRLVGKPHPLRLCYAGPVVRVKGETLRPERQFTQVGLELIGSPKPEADAEVIIASALAINELGISGLSVDLNLPNFASLLLDSQEVDDEARTVFSEALQHKDASALRSLHLHGGEKIALLLEAAGEAESALEHIGRIDLPPQATLEFSHLKSVYELIRGAMPDLNITIDPIEHRGFEYHSAISFSFFVKGVKQEVGRGGRYQIPTLHQGEPVTGTGVTFYLQPLLDALPTYQREKRVYICDPVSIHASRNLRQEGYITIHALESSAHPMEDARRAECDYILLDGLLTLVK
jgi:ATP phosphoribosyltransferase regulatory subunit